MFDMYVLSLRPEDMGNEHDFLVEAVQDGEWYSASMAAEAVMDQLNNGILETIPQSAYEKGQFLLYGVYKFEFKGLI